MNKEERLLLKEVVKLVRELERQGAGSELMIPPEDTSYRKFWNPERSTLDVDFLSHDYQSGADGEYVVNRQFGHWPASRDDAILETWIDAWLLTNTTIPGIVSSLGALPSLAQITGLLDPLKLLTNAVFGLSALRTAILAANATSGLVNTALNGVIKSQLNSLHDLIVYSPGFLPQDNVIVVNENKSSPTAVVRPTITQHGTGSTWDGHKEAGVLINVDSGAASSLSYTISSPRIHYAGSVAWAILHYFVERSDTTSGNGFTQPPNTPNTCLLYTSPSPRD